MTAVKTESVNAVKEQLDALNEISNLLTTAQFDLTYLLDEVVKITAKKLGVKACSVRLLDEQTGDMTLKAIYGLSPAYLNTGPTISKDSEFLKVIHTGQVHQIANISKDQRIHYSQEAIGEGICSQLSIGLIKEGATIGILSIFTEEMYHFSQEELQVFETIANQITAAVYLTQLHTKYIAHQRVEQELMLAAKIQNSLLPHIPTQTNSEIDVFAHCLPCEEIGGDFYEFMNLPNSKFGIGIGDVSGKGIPAALLMSSACMLLRTQAENNLDAYEIASRINQILCGQVLPEQFTTLFYGVIDPQAQTLRYVNAGHNFPLLVRKKQIITLEAGGPPVGMFADATYQEGLIAFLPGDLLVLYTDGCIDAVDQRGESFGEDRLRQEVLDLSLRSVGEIGNQLESVVARFEAGIDRRQDDRTIVVVKYLN